MKLWSARPDRPLPRWAILASSRHRRQCWLRARQSSYYTAIRLNWTEADGTRPFTAVSRHKVRLCSGCPDWTERLQPMCTRVEESSQLTALHGTMPETSLGESTACQTEFGGRRPRWVVPLYRRSGACDLQADTRVRAFRSYRQETVPRMTLTLVS